MVTTQTKPRQKLLDFNDKVIEAMQELIEAKDERRLLKDRIDVIQDEIHALMNDNDIDYHSVAVDGDTYNLEVQDVLKIKKAKEK